MRKTIAAFAVGLLLGGAASVSAEWDWGDFAELKELHATVKGINLNLSKIAAELKRGNDMHAAGCPLERTVTK